VQILEILPNAGSSAGGYIIATYGYGFGEDASRIAVKFGSAVGTSQKVEDVQSLSASLGLNAPIPFRFSESRSRFPQAHLEKLTFH